MKQSIYLLSLTTILAGAVSNTGRAYIWATMSADWWIGRASINILTLADGTSVLVPPELAINLRIPVWTFWLVYLWELVSVCAVFTGTLDEVCEVSLKLFFQPNLHLFLGLGELELTEIVGLLRSIVKGGDDLEGRILNTLHRLLVSYADECHT